ncbi:MAG: hypothetical protein ABI443_13865 [Chthoniobacterales bacterium]
MLKIFHKTKLSPLHELILANTAFFAICLCGAILLYFAPRLPDVTPDSSPEDPVVQLLVGKFPENPTFAQSWIFLNRALLVPEVVAIGLLLTGLLITRLQLRLIKDGHGEIQNAAAIRSFVVRYIYLILILSFVVFLVGLSVFLWLRFHIPVVDIHNKTSLIKSHHSLMTLAHWMELLFYNAWIPLAIHALYGISSQYYLLLKQQPTEATGA